jgi:Transposase DDE domain group 1
MLLAQADRRLGIAERFAREIPDGRDPDWVSHLLPDILRARIFAIACGYEGADDLDRLRLRSSWPVACRIAAGPPVLTTDRLAVGECAEPALPAWLRGDKLPGEVVDHRSRPRT